MQKLVKLRDAITSYVEVYLSMPRISITIASLSELNGDEMIFNDFGNCTNKNSEIYV